MNPVAYTYARALKDCFKKGQEESFFLFLEELKKWVESFSVSEVESFFISPAISVEQKKQVLKKTLDSCQYIPSGLENSKDKNLDTQEKKPERSKKLIPEGYKDFISSFLFLLLEKKRWKELSSILTCLTNMENKMKGVILVEVESVNLLTSSLREELVKKLEKFFGKKVSLKEKKVSAKLIGGMRVRVDGVVFDDTLSFHLMQMENQIRRNFHDYTS